MDGTIGGSYYSLLYLIRGLDRARYEPLVVFYTAHRLLDAFRDAGAETIVWPRPRPFALDRRLPDRLQWLRWPVVVAGKALNLLRGLLIPALSRAWFLVAKRIDIVHLNSSITRNHDWMLAAMLAGRKCVTHERGINQRYSAVSRYFGRRLDAVVCVSEAVRQNMRDRAGDWRNLLVIHNGLDPAAMRVRTSPLALRQAYGIAPEAPVVVMVGNIKGWKGQDILVRAIAAVRRVCPRVRCVLVGDTSPLDQDYARAVSELVESLGLGDCITFAGSHEHVADFLAMSDIVVHASVLPEPFGRVVLEAMACRRPVIGSNSGGVPEIIEHGETGLLFPPGDVYRLADALVRLITNEEEARRMGEKGYDRLVSRFHIARNVEATERVYTSLCGAGD